MATIDFENLNPVERPAKCSPEQCRSCPLHEKFCAGWETCCGGGYSETQKECNSRCDNCLGMFVHNLTWNVCGKSEALLQPLIRPEMPAPQYTVALFDDNDLPAYIPVFERLPRGPFRELPNIGMAGLAFQDVVAHKTRPTAWTRYTDKPLVLVAEQDYLQHQHEGWFPTWARRARAAGDIWAVTSIEFSCYAEHGNFAHFWSIQRSYNVANKARAEFIQLYPRNRLLLDDFFVEWVKAVPNVVLSYPLQTNPQYEWRKLKKLVAAVGGWNKIRFLLAHCPVNNLPSLPVELRRSSSWADQSAFSSAIAGGRAAHAGLSKIDTFLTLIQERCARVNKLLRPRRKES